MKAAAAARRICGAAAGQRRALRLEEAQRYSHEQRKPAVMMGKYGKYTSHGSSPEEGAVDGGTLSRFTGSLPGHKFQRKAFDAVRYRMDGRILGQEVRVDNPEVAARRHHVEVGRIKQLQQAEQRHAELLGKRGALEQKRRWQVTDVNYTRRGKPFKPKEHTEPWGEAWGEKAAALTPEAEETAHWTPRGNGHKVPISFSEALTQHTPVNYDEAEQSVIKRFGAVVEHQPTKEVNPRRDYLVDMASPRVHNRLLMRSNYKIEQREHLRTRNNVPDALRPAPYEAGTQFIPSKVNVHAPRNFWKNNRRHQAHTVPTSEAHTMNDFFH